MSFRDFSPPANPTREDQRDALQKGLGRAVQWARGGRLDADLLLTACVEDQTYDITCEPHRALWLWRLLNASHLVAELKRLILRGFLSYSTERSTQQLCGLALQYALNGDRDFNAALRQLIDDRPFPDIDPPLQGQEELIALSGVDGWIAVARARGRWLKQHEWTWCDASFAKSAETALGETEFLDLLLQSNDGDLSRFKEAWLSDLASERAFGAPQSSRSDDSLTVEDVFGIVSRAPLKTTQEASLRGWGMRASPEQLTEIACVLWNATEATSIACLLRVFSNRPLPEFDARLIELACHADDSVQRRARIAIAKNSHPLVREFALQELMQEEPPTDVGSFFIRNFEPGDERRLLSAIAQPLTPDDRHSVITDLLEVLDLNADSTSAELGLVIYGESPCAVCRANAVRLLVRDQATPDWLLEECRDDSEEKVRELVDSN